MDPEKIGFYACDQTSYPYQKGAYWPSPPSPGQTPNDNTNYVECKDANKLSIPQVGGGTTVYDDNTAPIQFVNPPSGVYVSPSTDNEYNATDHVVVPSRGTILLFPSNIRHRVLKNYSQYERYSLAFNVLPKGHVDVGDSSYTYQ